jgi:hypothetical protein
LKITYDAIHQNPSISFQSQAPASQQLSPAAKEVVKVIKEINKGIKDKNIENEFDSDLGFIRYSDFIGK